MGNGQAQSKSMPAIIEILKQARPASTLKFDDGCNAAVRANNDDIIAAADEQPAVGGNLAKMGELQGE